MIKLIHCADLHLTEKGNKRYSLSVLEEIVSITLEQKASILIFAGDLFDTFKDAESMRMKFREMILPLDESCEIYWLPGNHEILKKKSDGIKTDGFWVICKTSNHDTI